MKIVKMNLILVLLIGMALITNAQSSNEWRMILNNDHSLFQIKMNNKEMTFYFNSVKDTLSFSQGNKKAIKSGFVIEIIVKNNNKVIYTSDDKNLNSDKTAIIIPMSDVYNSLKNIKLPSKPKYMIAVKNKKDIKESILFEFTDK
jgi:hypothetical protein